MFKVLCTSIKKQNFYFDQYLRPYTSNYGFFPEDSRLSKRRKYNLVSPIFLWLSRFSVDNVR